MEKETPSLKQQLEQCARELQASEERFRSVIYRSADGILIVDRAGIVRFANPATEALFGRAVEELVGAAFGFPAVAGETTEIDIIAKGGQTRIAEMRVVETIWESQTAYLASLRDITERKRAEQERADLIREQAARQQAEIASRAKDEFLATLSHELRTPLNAIFGWTKLLASHDLSEDLCKQAIETIDRNARLQARLIDDMLDVSRIVSGKLRLDTQPVDLPGVIHAAVDTLQSAADAKNIRIDVVLAYGAGLVLGDPVRLQQVVWNLLSNAIKFSSKGRRVQIELQRINSHYEITVSDTGPGIDEAFLPHVFDPFRQADSTTTRKHGGLGLGLAIVRHLVELHGGTVEAGNRVDGKGAVFTIALPVMVVRQSKEAPAGQFAGHHASASRHALIDRMPALSGLKVLVVDDDADARQLLSAILEQCGAEVITQASSAAALEALQKFKPDILVSDIGMPEEDGYALIEKVRSLESVGDDRIPAVALTAYARAEDRLRALSAGYNMHVPKPVEPAELAIVIASLTSHSRKL
jgi:signal transduction histidine kinase/ActR/RegA family two-component response regulator